jgi:hypothetical protein
MMSERVDEGERDGKEGWSEIQKSAQGDRDGVGAERRDGEHLTRRDSFHFSNHDACD